MKESSKLKKVVVAMSGGVDSSVAALLLQQEGYDVVGVTMKLYSLDESALPADHQGCCTLDDVEDARTVCRKLDIPHYVLNMEREFRSHVMDYFVSEYQKGRTPHPCIACNDKIKFSYLMDRADVLDADFIATGHYAQIQRTSDGFVLRKAVDHSKDQTYVLFRMNQEQLARTLMPVGAYTKADIRRLAIDSGLVTADKPDSQDICFVPLGDYKSFLREQTISTGGTSGGQIVDLDGMVVGKHEGIEFYTVGQRRGLGISQTEPRYVIRLEPATNRVVVGPEKALYSREMWVSGVNYVQGSGCLPQGALPVGVKIRYKSYEAPAELQPRGDRALVRFREPQRSLTPGQAAVFYYGDVLLGGGTIEPQNVSEYGRSEELSSVMV